ncbi:MAG: Mpo1-like protein [Pirellulales bacterium]
MLKSQKTADQWFDEYAVCHQNHTNKILHWICIPLIMLSLIGLIWAIPVPALISRQFSQFNWAWLTLAACLMFYSLISMALMLGMFLLSVAFVGIIVFYQWANFTSVASASLFIFVSAWIGQFVGHKIEGRKPAFFDDLKFLLIGPLWLLGFIYRRLGIRY